MRIKSENAIKKTDSQQKGEKVFEFTLNLKDIRTLNGSTLSEKLFNEAKKNSNEFLSNVYFSVAKLLEQLKNEEDEQAKSFLSCVSSSDGCTWVWYACGSCQGNYALVEAFCPEGDYQWCEKC